jgi:hypothetical protein
METELLVRTFPKLYHMAHVDSWDGIRRHGLLSTSALLDLFEVNGAERERIESFRRTRSVQIEHRVHGTAVIRDNIPMDDRGLDRALIGVTPTEWYELLNNKVFFWLTEERLTTLLSAGAYRGRDHCVLTLNAHSLIQRHEQRISLSPMNSGCTKPYPHARDRNLFQRIADYPFEHFRRKKGGPRKAVVELAVDHAVPDIVNFVELVTIRNEAGIVREVWRQ